MKKALLNKMDMRMPKTDLKLEDDPYLRLGKFSTKSFSFITMCFSNV